jgi:hypothetical protein
MSGLKIIRVNIMDFEILKKYYKMLLIDGNNPLGYNNAPCF